MLFYTEILICTGKITSDRTKNQTPVCHEAWAKQKPQREPVIIEKHFFTVREIF